MRLSLGQNHVAMASGASAPQESQRRRTDVLATCQRITGRLLPGAWAGPVDIVGPPPPLPASSFARGSFGRRRGRLSPDSPPGPGGPGRGPFGPGSSGGGTTGGGVPSAPSPGVGFGGGGSSSGGG